jgi:hypothetical protein
MPGIHPDGRIVHGEAVLFPNLHAYSSHSAVSVYSPRRHYLPLGETFLERLHWEGAVDLAPESVARLIGERFAAC